MTLTFDPPGPPVTVKPVCPPGLIPLDHLPYHILKRIAGFSDELSIWRLGGTSRALRVAAEIPLRRYLATKSVTSKPPYVSDILSPMDITAANDSARYTTLENTVQLFQAHLAIFPTSLHLLRNLTVEVRVDDYHAGWQQIKRFASKLEQLTLHFVDPVGLVPDDSDGEYDEFDDEGTMAFLWPELVDKPLINLVSLDIATNIRILQHFGGIAPFVPSLRDLTLSCFGTDQFEYTVFDAPDLSLTFDNLKRLTLAGYISTVTYCANRIIPLARNLANLTIHVPPDSAVSPMVNEQVSRTSKLLSKRKTMTTLGLYGGAANVFIESMASLQIEDPERHDFGHVTGMTLERLGGKQGRGTYPLLDIDTSSTLLLPSLRYITYFDRSVDQSGCFTLGTIDKTGFHDFYHSAPLHKLFNHQHSLKQIFWIAGYPRIPLEDIRLRGSNRLENIRVQATEEQQSLRCCIFRIQTKSDHHSSARDDPGLPGGKLKLRAQRALWGSETMRS